MPCIDTVQGFSFCPAAREPLTSIYRDLSAVHAIYTARTPKPFTWLYRSVSVNSTHSRAHNTAATQAACTPPASRWRAYRQAQHLHRYQIPTPRRTLYRPAQPPYYNKVYKGAAVRPMLWIHAGRCSIPQTIPARRGQLLPSADRWQVLHPAHLLGSASPPVQCKPGGMGAAARNHWRLAPHLFSGFRPIANRGQQ